MEIRSLESIEIKQKNDLRGKKQVQNDEGYLILEYTDKSEIQLDQYSNINSSQVKYEFLTQKYINAQTCIIKQIKELRQNTNEGSTLLVDIKLNNNSSYLTAQNLEIYPQNDPHQVSQLATYLNLDQNQNVQFKNFNKEIEYPFPTPISIRNIFGKFCDFQGQLMKKTLIELSKLTKNEQYKNQLLFLAEDKGQFQIEILNKRKTLFDLMKEYQIVPNLDQFIQLCPRISPRAFTIASSNLDHPDIIQIADSLVIEKLSNNQIKYGLCSKYLINCFNKYKNKMTGNRIRISIKNSSFILQNNNKPIIMIGTGTGVAPFIAFCQEKLVLRNKNIFLGDFSLFFGCRYQNQDFIFKEDILKFKEDQIINNLFAAFSRDDAEKKVYVQDLIMQNKQFVYETLFLKNGNIYICGNTFMGQDIMQSLNEIVQIFQKVDKKQASKLTQELESEKRIVKELW
ncbi:hypothetical protein IMG5_190720 [Ichthyophthirius multifiliis]|uniref:NADPH--hemoprotein reductase n=1 Tax=Ichthyophthirius multifiliis TaxID=5932 RepID=G0R4A5_ICHMU|nr:hypothetical protein IMG5_190720 [Ichthyophthirius multifiliis]EGR27716.1 hypothetical protein IMG5_190720 [Ichthyophthirius multifiliis]|eukprot:XP_004025168.1 hypothetical protein IMG5_190720 [Ichthyophthirius multifiliis]